MSDQIKIKPDVETQRVLLMKSSLQESIVSWLKSLIIVEVDYSTTPIGKHLLTVDIPLISGYVNITVRLSTLILLQGYIKL